MRRRQILLINPWITDVAAFDLWAWPLGLLYWAARLKEWGFEVGLIDCTDRAHPSLNPADVSRVQPFGKGKYRTELFTPQPDPARRARRRFRRYGIAPADFEGELAALEARDGAPPDAVLVTSRMTYWHHGVADAIARVRRRWPETPVLLGGGYATLCPEHARGHSGAARVFQGSGFEQLPLWLGQRFPEMAGRISVPSPDPETWPRPAFDLCHSRAALPLLTSVGCPFRCAYCASPLLAPVYARRSAEAVFSEAADYRERWGTADFAFYDDALLVDCERFFEPFLDRVIASGMEVRFHTPNGLHYAPIDLRLAGKMRRAGVETIRLSLETCEEERLAAWNRRGSASAFLRAIDALQAAGYGRGQIGVYILAGAPGQTYDEVARTIEYVFKAGAQPKLNEFSPIPGTAEWVVAVDLANRRRPGAGQELIEEPLWQNNCLYYTREETLSREQFAQLKMMARG